MSGFIGTVLEAIVDFVTDVWLLRRHRAARKRPENAWEKDAADVAVLNIWMMVAGLVLMVITCIMLFVLKLPVWLSLVPLIAGIVYFVYRWFALVRA